jgi:hypothetical protein
MLSINIAGTSTTPKIECDPDKGIILMQGDSYPENSFEFFNALLSWVDDYLHLKTAPLALELRLVYLNTSSVKVMMDIFDMLEEAYLQGRKIDVNWFYDNRNERVMDLAEEFKEDCSFPFLIASDG